MLQRKLPQAHVDEGNMYPRRLASLAWNRRATASAAFGLFCVFSTTPCLADDSGSTSPPASLRIQVVVVATVETPNPPIKPAPRKPIAYSLQGAPPPGAVTQAASRRVIYYPQQPSQRNQATPAIVETLTTIVE